MNKFIKIALLIILSLITIAFDDLYNLATFYFYTLLLMIVFDIIKKREINLIHVWCIGFIYIILSEVFIIFELQKNPYSLLALKYLIIANNIILIGYSSKKGIKMENVRIKLSNYKAKRGGGIILIMLVLFYVSMSWQAAILSFTLGRDSGSEGENFILSSILNAMGFILPSVILFYFYYIKKKSLLYSFIISIPIFIILFMGGSRFPLLFSFVSFFITYKSLNPNRISVKQIALLFSASIILLSSSLAMKEFRTGNQFDDNYKESKVESKDFPTYISQYLSNEGVIDMTSLMIKHFDSNEHLYGASSSFILYFWVPRSIWKEKPTMLGYWFIRKYRSGFGDGHSASFGFTGDLFADFGYFSLFFIFFIGRFIKIAENFNENALKSKNYKVIIGAMLFPYIFFFVRSPITASMTFLGIIFFFYFFKKTVFTEIINSNK